MSNSQPTQEPAGGPETTPEEDQALDAEISDLKLKIKAVCACLRPAPLIHCARRPSRGGARRLASRAALASCLSSVLCPGAQAQAARLAMEVKARQLEVELKDNSNAVDELAKFTAARQAAPGGASARVRPRCASLHTVDTQPPAAVSSIDRLS